MTQLIKKIMLEYITDMSYYFIEHRNPSQDSNIDLNFNDDMLYSSVTDAIINKHDTREKFVTSKDLSKSSNKIPKKDNMDKTANSSNAIYVMFIMIVIISIILWYVFGTKGEIKQKDIIDTYPDQPELMMLSPDIGMDSRFGIL